MANENYTGVNNKAQNIEKAHHETNFKWCKRYYDEVYKYIENDNSDEILAHHYNETMRNAYMRDKLNGIISCMSIFEFLDKLKMNNKRRIY